MRARREPKNKVKKGMPKKPQHVFFHVFAQTTHVVAAPHGFASVVIPATRLYIPSFIEIRSGVSEPRGFKIWPFPLLWLVAFTTACTTVQAVMPYIYPRRRRWQGYGFHRRLSVCLSVCPHDVSKTDAARITKLDTKRSTRSPGTVFQPTL